MKTMPLTRPVDFTLAVVLSPLDRYEWSKVLLARASFDGTLELLTLAWQRVLGYGRRELEGKPLSQLMWSNKPAAADVVATILDERNMAPVNMTMRCRDGVAKRFTLHRRFHRHANWMFIVAEEISGRRSSDQHVDRRASAIL
jgi:PAS domain-containing protein